MATTDTPAREFRDRTLVDYVVPGSTFEDISGALAKGYRLIELHIYSDAQDEPVVALRPDYEQTAHRSFVSCCEVIVNEAFPSDDPLIVSLVAHTDKSFTLNRVAYHLNSTVRKHLVSGLVEDKQLDTLANKLILVSGNEVRGTNLEPMLNLSWNDSRLRRLTYQQAAYPREPEELRSFTKSNIVLVAPDQAFSKFKVMDDVYAYGCQWNLCPTSGRTGFIPRG
jgi:hypothetical protein